MTRLIDADALIDAVKVSIDEEKEIYPDDKSSIIFRAGMKNVIGIVKNQDTVDPVKHGHWENDGIAYVKCSICGQVRKSIYPFANDDFNYCPNCGAKMDENSLLEL